MRSDAFFGSSQSASLPIFSELMFIAKKWYNRRYKKEYQATNHESGLTDEQWEAIKEFFPSGNKSKYHKRSLVKAVLYIVKTGCQWRMLPHNYPPHDTVWSFYRRARNNGVWDKMMKHLSNCECLFLALSIHVRYPKNLKLLDHLSL